MKNVRHSRWTAAPNARQASGWNSDTHRCEYACHHMATPYAPNSASASVRFRCLCRRRKCSITRDVIRMFTEETNANTKAAGVAFSTCAGVQREPSKLRDLERQPPDFPLMQAKKTRNDNRSYNAE